MPKPAWEDLDVFLQSDDFASFVTIQFQAGGIRQINAIFDDPYLNAQLGEYEMDTSRPRLTCNEADTEGVLRGDVIVIDGVSYDVLSSPQSDGTGMALLDLAKQI